MKITLATKITISRMLLTLPAVALYVAGQFASGKAGTALTIVACALYAIACITDLVDGIIARSTHSVSVLGKYLDPVADKVNLCLMLFAIACFGDGLDAVFGANRVVVALLGGLIFARELLVGMLRTVAAARGKVIAADVFGKIKTDFLNVGTIVLVVAGLHVAIAWIGTILYYIGAVIAVFSGVNYFVKNKSVFADDDADDMTKSDGSQSSNASAGCDGAAENDDGVHAPESSVNDGEDN